VEAGATSIVAGKITDERGNTSLCGVAAPVYVPSSQVEVVGAMNMQGHALTGLPVPSAGTDAARRDMGGATLQNLGAPVNPNDAARKAYVDDKVAGFGISDIAIDANKNWNGKNITNVGQLQANSVTTTTYTLIPDPCIWYQDNTFKQTNSTSFTVLKTANPVPTGVSGIVAVHYDLDGSSCESGVYVQLRKNGSVIQSHAVAGGGREEYIDTVAVTPGDVISIAFHTNRDQDYVENRLFEIRAIPMPGPVSIAPW
jgi:hypothetical protein